MKRQVALLRAEMSKDKPDSERIKRFTDNIRNLKNNVCTMDCFTLFK